MCSKKNKTASFNCVTYYNTITLVQMQLFKNFFFLFQFFLKILRQRLFLKIYYTLSVLSSLTLGLFLILVISNQLFLTCLIKVDFTASEVKLVVNPLHKFHVFHSK